MSDRANQLISRHPAPDPRGDRRERRHLRGVPGRQAVVHRRRRGRRVAAVRRRLHRARRRGAGVRQPRRLPGHDPRPVPPARRAAARRAVRAPAPPRRAGRPHPRLRPRDRRRRQAAGRRQPRHLAGGRRGPLLGLHARPAGGQPARPGPHRRRRPLRVHHRDPGAVHDPAGRADGQDDRRRRLEPVAPGAHPPDRQRRGLRAAGHPAVHRHQRLPRQRRRQRGQARADRAPASRRATAGCAFTYDFALAPARTPAIA